MYLISQTIKLNKPKVKALTGNTLSIYTADDCNLDIQG